MAIRARGRENAQYKAKERDEFFRRFDRGGTIRAVAAELGLSVESCYRWRNEAGVSTPRVKSRVYTTEDKAEFFRLLALTGNVSKVAKELGFVRVTCARVTGCREALRAPRRGSMHHGAKVRSPA